ncbi:PREDICTED: beta-D-glucosyl crocetin beta-1,6-glucosyltransferase-like [Ipomoea nil]|uniref:beta-D-glucosyl crocetin beta-1,6-glucosyltransferase-like n=1 Tax=Ipomoea nil TaxID=35883 RepID=UPI00090200C0|nr:PREDICTED: beta-D-glucosyl crocetin beta-1,6-glucosyltransferase-like [Ipomoea nil]
MGKEKPSRCNVLMFPWIAQGHFTPFLELAKILSSRNFTVHFCSSPTILESIGKVIAKHHPNLSPSIHLVELRLPSTPELPPHHHTTTALPPHLAGALQEAFQKTESTFYDIISAIDPDLLIYDAFQPWAASQASSLNIPAVHLATTGAVAISSLAHSRVDGVRGSKFPFPEIYYHDHEIRKFMAKKPAGIDLGDLGGLGFKSIQQSHKIIFINSCREMEGKYVDYLSHLTKKEVMAIGPLIRQTSDEEDHAGITQWLQDKPESSCVLASFGSEYSMSRAEMEEIAFGLEISGVNFIWVVKFPAGVATPAVEEAVPEGYLERVKGRGIVVKGWVPQAKILADKKICGFLSHCGWNSVFESLAFGVPIIALPLHLDQPGNARLVEEIGVGVEAMKGENGEIKREEIAKALRKVAMEKSGEEMKKKARELSVKMRLSGEKMIDEAVDKLIQLCRKN